MCLEAAPLGPEVAPKLNQLSNLLGNFQVLFWRVKFTLLTSI